MLALHGNGVGAGIAIGKARILRRAGQETPQYTIDQEQVPIEIERLKQGIAGAVKKLQDIDRQLHQEKADNVRAILNAHLLMLQDSEISEPPINMIADQRVNAEWALQQHSEHLKSVFRKIEDPYLSSKSIDVAQTIDRIQDELQNQQNELQVQPRGAFDGEVIVAHDLTPGDTIGLKNHRVGAFITNLGSPISHTAILARSMKIPAIVGLHGGIRYLRTGDLLIIDGKRGVVVVDPDADTLDAYRKRRSKITRRNQEIDTLLEASSATLDGIQITLNSNIELPDEISESESRNAAGVGLYRTEFLYMNREQLPDEDEQYGILKQVLSQTRLPVTIRTLDLGADKQVDGGRPWGITTTNPALGRRAIRLCLHDLGLFKPQLRAIYRASVHGEVKIMVPMLSNFEELDQLSALIDEVKHELTDQGHKFDPDVKIGGMIEVPATAIAADLFADRLDFFSIGTNDLIQYTLAIDRIDDAVNYLYDPLHPAILRLIQRIIKVGEKAGVPVSMCGEMAGDVRYTRVLLGMGLRDFSMDPALLLEVKRQIRLTDVSKIQPRIRQLLNTADSSKIQSIINEINL